MDMYRTFQYGAEYNSIPLKVSCGRHKQLDSKILRIVRIESIKRLARRVAVFSKDSPKDVVRIVHEFPLKFHVGVGLKHDRDNSCLRKCSRNMQSKACGPSSGLGPDNLEKLFVCKCGWILYQPCSLPCGHTLCKSCIEKAGFCLECGAAMGNQLHINVLLVSELLQMFPKKYEAADLKHNGCKLLKDDHYEEAVEKFTRGLELTPTDHTLYSFRSDAYLKLKQPRKALKDARKSYKIEPSCGYSHFRLGAAFAALGRLDDAITSYQTCLELEPDDVNLYQEVCENLDELLTAPGSPSESLISTDEDDDDEGSELGSVSEGSISGADCSDEEISMSDSRSSQNGSIRSQMEASDPKCNFVNLEQKDDLERQASQVPSCSKSDTTPSFYNSKSDLTANLASTSTESPAGDLALTDCPRQKRTLSSPTSNASSQDFQQKEKRVRLDASMELSIRKPSIDEFECKLCFDLLFQPVTTPCGHVFCRSCLERCLDHKAVCPNCRSDLTELIVERKRSVTEVLEKYIEFSFPKEYQHRKLEHETRMAKLARVGEDEDVEVPIFVCTIALPTLKCPLHVFEPRYRLMIRECVESGSRKFGMCAEDQAAGFAECGTILEIKNVRFLTDGRVIVDAVGEKRFKIISRDMRDGFNITKVKFFKDETDRSEEEGLRTQCSDVYNELSCYVSELCPAERECIYNALGPLPDMPENPLQYENGVSWVWWGLAALPLNNQAKLRLLKSTSLAERVSSLHRFLRFLKSQKRHARTNGNQNNSGAAQQL